MMKEGNYVINTFIENHKKHSQAPMALYGVGNNTKLLLDDEEIKNFNIVGLMDAECVGQNIYGKKVLSNEEVIKKCEIIIIVAQKIVLKIIYERIKFLDKEHGIKIYNIEGEELKNIFNKKSEIYDNLSYWNNTEEKLINMINSHEIVSFDIFDTLIMRNILKPTDIFKLVEVRIKEDLNINIQFENNRVSAEIELNKFIEAPTIDQIYECIQRKLGISDEVRDNIKNIEYEIECQYIIPRRKMIEIYNYAISCNKQVYLISDMYYDKEKIINLLKICGIDKINKNNILISCEHNKTKSSGKLFEYYKSINIDKTMLHIGDNENSDIKIPPKYGIESFGILSAYDMLVHSTYSSMLIKIESVQENIILGMIIGKIFNNPFALNKGRGRYIVNDLETLGYVFWGPFVLNFMIWLINNLKKSKYKVVLFVARDGYLINYLYEYIIKTLKLKNMPEPIYFKTSRRAITVPTIKTKEDILFILKKPYKCTKAQLLKERFGINISGNKGDKVLINSEENNNKILEYSEEIIKNAAIERRNYFKYINSLEKLTNKNNIAIFDLYSSGTIQYYLSKLINKKIHGFYLATNSLPNLYYKDNSYIDAQLGNQLLYNPQYSIIRHYQMLESVFTDPNNTLIKCDCNGEFCYLKTDSKELRDFSKINLIHDGIKSFIYDYIMLNKNNALKEVRLEFTDDIFNLFVSDKSIVIDEIKDVFYFESSYEAIYECNVWNSEY